MRCEVRYIGLHWMFFSTSQGLRRERDIFFQSLMFRDGNEICKLISRRPARKNEPNSHENSWDRAFLLCSALGRVKREIEYREKVFRRVMTMKMHFSATLHFAIK